MQQNEFNVNETPASTIAKLYDGQLEVGTYLSVPEELEPVIAPGMTFGGGY
jgi:hypothetical protein